MASVTSSIYRSRLKDHIISGSLDARYISVDPDGLKLSKKGTITIDDDFVMPIQEFKACLKVLQKLARKEYPEDFI